MRTHIFVRKLLLLLVFILHDRNSIRLSFIHFLSSLASLLCDYGSGFRFGLDFRNYLFWIVIANLVTWWWCLEVEMLWRWWLEVLRFLRWFLDILRWILWFVMILRRWQFVLIFCCKHNLSLCLVLIQLSFIAVENYGLKMIGGKMVGHLYWNIEIKVFLDEVGVWDLRTWSLRWGGCVDILSRIVGIHLRWTLQWKR